MRLSQLFSKTKNNAPADETAKNAQLLIQAGFIHKEMAGVYSFLPLGLKVLNNIAQIVREEMDGVGGQEILMPALQIKDRYEATNRWSDEAVDSWFKTKLANGTEMGLGFSHEENLVPLVKNFVSSYKDLPFAPYQIQTKFRNELRSKSGLMRGREFLMKDMYSFSLDSKQHDDFYAKMQAAYQRIFDRLGIGETTFMTFASGGSFSKFSHEFQTLSKAGEDTIYLDRKNKVAINKEVYTDEVISELGLDKSQLEEAKGIEVGNIFNLGTRFSEPFNLTVTDKAGQVQTVIMGCYGIGISRLMGTIAELTSDARGLIWSENITPFKVYLARLGNGTDVMKQADGIYEKLQAAGVTVLYDDRNARPGEKFADADLLGLPYRLVASEKTLKDTVYELKKRTEDKAELVSEDELIKRLAV